jgi:hypothetical protein
MGKLEGKRQFCRSRVVGLILNKETRGGGEKSWPELMCLTQNRDK